MQLGFVNFNTEEKKRISKMMQLLSEPGAIEELGIGRVRDHFSNTLFPGTSTLQHMPSISPFCRLYTITLLTAAGNSVVYVKWSDSS